ncbi:hypothetical protein HW555_003853 [Spodoptera exigua]|uniref:Uncharacterized protein n=1 Tax=Spodoptera exigua TaxID=7107 RepID=A0A835L6K9_SPOEX|nr:hypothetical protein HW555_003853 [Spodoptera exigua]
MRYLKIRRAMRSDNSDVLFNGDYGNIDCVFIIYTTSSGHFNKRFESCFANKLNELICTGGNAFHISCDDESVQLLRKIYIEEQMRLLGISVASHLCKSEYKTMLSDKLILQYHVILAKRVMEVTDIQPEGHRLAKFRHDFFYTNEEFLSTFRDSLFKELLKSEKVSDSDIAFLVNSSLDNNRALYPLFGKVINYNQGKLEFYNKNTPDKLKRVLKQVAVSKGEFIAEMCSSAKTTLADKLYKVPAAFGNNDLTIRGNVDKIENSLEVLSSKLSNLLKQCQENKIINIDEALGKEFLQDNGDLDGIIGNLIVLDEHKKLMKFTDHPQMSEDLARRLFDKIKLAHPDMHKYRFDIKVENIPKLAFECNQADEGMVEKILKQEIEDNQIIIDKYVKLRSDAIFLIYHDAIQKWWMSTTSTYLTKEESHNLTIANIIKDPVMSLMTTIYKNKIKAIDYEFKENMLTNEDNIFNAIISTDNSALSVAKVLQIIKNREHYLIDVEYILHLPVDEETKLKVIRFQEKNKMDIFNPDIVYTYEKERADFIMKHKRLAAYSMFPRLDENLLFNEREMKEINDMLNLIKKGGEKTGLIYSVASNDKPVFVHRTFAEYFAVEHLCDLLKKEQDLVGIFNLACVSQSLNKSVTQLTWFHCNRLPGVPSVQIFFSGDEDGIEYVASAKNCADALSRLPQPTDKNKIVQSFLPVTNDDVRLATARDQTGMAQIFPFSQQTHNLMIIVQIQKQMKTVDLH